MEIRQSVKHLKGPFIRYLGTRLTQLDKGFDDEHLHQPCHDGFPFVGELPAIHYGTAEATKAQYKITPDEMRENRKENNERILRKVRDSDWVSDLVDGTHSDALQGWMDHEKRLEPEDVRDNSLFRILVVREFREHLNDGKGGERSRIVDHLSEGDQNMATWCSRKCRVDGLDPF